MKHFEIQSKPPAELEIPEVFDRLRDVAYNFWWSWSPRAHRLFHAVDPATWRRYRNPIELLIDLSPTRWDYLQNDDEFTHAYHLLVGEFDAYMNPDQPTWFRRTHADVAGPFAYFSTEYGWHESLQIYSGGLGVLSGDHCKSASDLGLPFVGIGLMYRHGYFKQTIDAEGFQQHFYPDYDMHRLPLLPVVDDAGRELYVAVDLPGRQVQLRAWKAAVGRLSVLLLDSDLPINHPSDRPITSMLYVRGREMRLCQEILLGVGGVRLLSRLGIEPAAWHMNEGHSALLVVQRIVEQVREHRVSFEDALRRVVRNTVFTTHTPVPAGNEIFDTQTTQRYLEALCDGSAVEPRSLLALGRTGGDHGEHEFNLTALALRTSCRANGVSRKHGEVADSMWRGLLDADGPVTIESVTNGVHQKSWIGPELGELLERHLGKNYDERLLDSDFGALVDAIPDHEIWTAHLSQKRRLVRMIRDRTVDQAARHGRSPGELRGIEDMFDPDALIVGFARRFATYKRADLILREMQRIEALVGHDERPVQFVFAGKAHPADRPGQDLIRRIYLAAQESPLKGRFTFIENYDMNVARRLVQGVDVWLNTPRRPLEASGTSGMKAAMNGVLNCSILDGWWCEGYDASHGWAIGTVDSADSEEDEDGRDADSIYKVLADEVVPCYYTTNKQGLPEAWIARMKRAIACLSPQFSTERMVREYAESYYLPAAQGSLEQPRPESTRTE